MIQDVTYLVEEDLDVFVYDQLTVSVALSSRQDFQVGVDGVEHYQLAGCDGTDRTASRKSVQMYLEIVFRCEVKYGHTSSDDVDAEIFRLLCNEERNLWTDDQKVASFHVVFLQSDFDFRCSAHADQT